MEPSTIEVLLLDTTEKEGEDNLLYHFAIDAAGAGAGAGRSAAPRPTRWRELRGVLAAVMGATQTIMGEPLATAHFRVPLPPRQQHPEAAVGFQETVVAYVNLYEVLFAFVLDGVALPASVVEYYCVQACTLLVSLLGYPGQKLEGWQSQIMTGTDLAPDLRFETHLQFAFDGVVPVTTYSLDVLARLSAFQVIDPTTDLLHLFYWLRHDDVKTFQAFRLTPTELLSTGDLDELVAFAASRLAPQFEAIHAASHLPPSCCCLVIDRLRHTLLGPRPSVLLAQPSRSLSTACWLELLALLVRRLPTIASVVVAPTTMKTSRWVPNVSLKSNDPDAVFLSPLRPEDKGGDLSSDDDAQIFPPVAYQLQREAERPQRHVHSRFERHQLGGLSVWLLFESFEAFDRVALWTDRIDDAQAALDQEMDRLLLIPSTPEN
ncbi:hypothetical protein ATCC90586_003124 [Pythium insidiosum]|nr:hypothetical protein ATCC90586_003124 [Pythium insidiosum]